MNVWIMDVSHGNRVRLLRALPLQWSLLRAYTPISLYAVGVLRLRDVLLAPPGRQLPQVGNTRHLLGSSPHLHAARGPVQIPVG